MVHFTSLFGVDFDFDLLPFWINHYQKFNFDRYHIHLHSRKNNVDKLHDSMEMLDRAGFDYEIVESSKYYLGSTVELDPSSTLRQLVIDHFFKNIPPSDFVVVADSDEFHQMPCNYKDILTNYDYVFGELVDKYDTILHAAYPDIPVELQYRHTGDVHAIVRQLHKPSSDSWFYLHKTKILACRASIPVNNVGSHNLLGELIGTARKDLYNILDEMDGVKPIAVHHYTWRDSIIDRMCDRPYYTAEQIIYTARFFGIDTIESPYFHEKLKQEDALQEEKGWEPCRSRII